MNIAQYSIRILVPFITRIPLVSEDVLPQGGLMALFRGVKLIFTGGHVSLAVAFKRLNVVSGQYNYLTTP